MGSTGSLNGDVYEGEFVDDVRSGYGKYTWANGEIYESEFAGNKMNGMGKTGRKAGYMKACLRTVK